VKFRADKEDQLIEANGMGDGGQGSYVFYGAENDIVAQVPQDAVISVVEEKAASR
jgi:hypothetical protein